MWQKNTIMKQQDFPAIVIFLTVSQRYEAKTFPLQGAGHFLHHTQFRSEHRPSRP
jgi:hypothetical protein